MRTGIKRSLAAIAVAIVAVLTFSQGASAAGGKANNPQAPGGKTVASVAAPNQCTLVSQTTTYGQHFGLYYNAPEQYNSTTNGTNFYNLKCGHLTFTLPPGTDATVNMSDTAELDCSDVNSNTTAAWCDGRFVVSSVHVLPDNTDRSDSYAWDASIGGTGNWSAHSLVQGGRALCRSNTPCVYSVQLQSRFDAGATDLWFDDSTMTVDVIYGAVTVTNITP